jgi:Ca-activated chloride channel homolog
MLRTMTTGGGLAATTALVAVGVILVLPEGRDILRPPAPAVVLERAEVPQVAPRAAVPAATRTLAEEAPADNEAPALADAAPATGLVAAAPPAPAAAVRERSAMPGDAVAMPEADTEAFANADDNPLRVTAEAPVSTFSIDVDTASYAVVRSSLMAGMLPPREAVRVEEMVNYFPYAYPAPDGDVPFRPTVTVMPTPWNPGTELVHIAIRGEMPPVATRPPLNLVFLIDTSGSMQDANKLPLLKQSFRLMLGELGPRTRWRSSPMPGRRGWCWNRRPPRSGRRSSPRSTGWRRAGRRPGRRGSRRPMRWPR